MSSSARVKSVFVRIFMNIRTKTDLTPIYKHSYYLLTHAHHSNPNAAWQCDFWSASGSELTWRSATLHFTEGYGGWYVVGNHWTSPDRGRTSILMATTDATDCSIYDGWWDAN